MASPLTKLRAIANRLRRTATGSSPGPETAVVWYIESRGANEQGAAPSDAVLGSGVVVRLERLERADSPAGVRWISKTPPEIKNYLLTCAHVVRHVLPNNSGWSPVLGEILCWKPGSHFQQWQHPERPRRTGETRQLGAHRAHPVLGRLAASAVPADQTTLWNDWVLLDVDDGPSGTFDHSPAVQRWRELTADHEVELSVVGYPGGSSN